MLPILGISPVQLCAVVDPEVTLLLFRSRQMPVHLLNLVYSKTQYHLIFSYVYISAVLVPYHIIDLHLLNLVSLGTRHAARAVYRRYLAPGYTAVPRCTESVQYERY
eukprot:SAG31_NODE_3579_length_4102_cov_3.565326_3_plen_107_part_00